MTPALVPPGPEVAESFRSALIELRAEGRFGPADDTALAAALREAGPVGEPAGFATFVEHLRDRAATDTPDRVASTMLWWVDGAEYLGRISIRHRLTPELRSAEPGERSAERG